MYKYLTITALVATILLAACASSPKVEMTASEKLFRSKCRNCHVLPNVGSMKAEDWATTIEKHESRTNLKPSEKEEILQYLIGNKSTDSY